MVSNLNLWLHFPSISTKQLEMFTNHNVKLSSEAQNNQTSALAKTMWDINWHSAIMCQEYEVKTTAMPNLTLITNIIMP